ncbi:helix-turn-helix transcriptional regulator [Pontibacter cellulosilyticus]|uniref:WYL domain-containing protein n=1 Tax=Pontibacter cellulosilyticus TaxID=1720253 RepID=A0A923SJP4_9BACT|nr:WYL domain-containing protein [Pontibacter cellulosilyticus]MBC5994028.1 WYL domain-containing protein [Pontibacter cellulosilyticus]
MPKTKHAIVRMRLINECLRSKARKYWSKTELIDKISAAKDIRIGERTLDYDIYQMRYCSQLNYNAPIAYSKKENGYYYTDPEYTIENLPLNEVELHALATAAATLGQYRHMAVFSEFASTVDKVVNLVQQISSDQPGANSGFIDFEKAPYAKGNEYLDTIIGAIRNKHTLRLSYRKFEDAQPKNRTISPYLLKEYRNRWYLVGLQHETGSLRKFALDRIQSLESAPEAPYIEKADFKPELYFKNAIGISQEDGQVEEVVLSFSPYDGNYVKTQHLHSSQELLVDDDKEVRVKLKVVLNYELEATILSFGKEVRVIAPEALRQKIRQILDACRKQYQDC